MSSGAVLQVVILRSGALVGTEMLVPGDYRIGREASCELHIDEPTLSRVHARLVFNGTRVGIQDLGSDNGVLINGEKIQAREVKSLDDVLLGKVTLKFKVIGRKDEPAPERAPLDRTVPLAARPSSAQLRAALEPVPTPPPSRAMPQGRQPTGPASRISDPDPDVTAPGEPPGIVVAAGGLLNATQPSARRAQVAPEIKSSAPPAPPRPVIGLVPPPAARGVAEEARPATEAKSSGRGSLNATVPKAAAPDLLDQSVPTGMRVPPQRAEAPETTAAVLPAQPSVRARVLWGDQMTACRTFAFGEAVIAAERESAALPVYHLGLAKPTVLARVHSSGWAVHVPKGVIVESWSDAGWVPTQPSSAGKGMGIVPLGAGAQVRIRQGRIAVEFASVAPQPKLPPKKSQLEMTLLVPLVAGIAAALSLIIFMPKNLDVPDFVPQKLPGIRPALLQPPKKPEPPKQKPQKPTEHKQKAPPKVVHQSHQAAPKQVQAPKAVAALAKLTASPAMAKLLTATQHIGGGGRPNGLKMVGLKGIGPVALLGSGPGQGGGFGGGPVTGGREKLLGIGAIGIGHALNGKVHGTVAAPARSAQVHGSISREEIAKVINSHMHQIQQCYERALLHEPGLAGKLVIKWTIGLSGEVASVGTQNSSLKDPGVGECILDKLKAWRFPRPQGGTVQVTYPFVFNSVGF